MNSKTILKTLAMAMLMPAMLLTTSCSSEDDLVNNTANTENTINKGYALPVTVNVTRQGDATTRATYTYDEGTKKGTLSFSAGDKLFVWGSAYGYDCEFAGELTWQSGGTFSGTIYINNEWTDTADALFTAATSEGYVNAALLPAGYESYGFLTIEDNDTEDKYDDFISDTSTYTYTLATSKADGVAQFSYEEATSYSSGFELEPQNAILNFTITGLAANTSVDVSLTSYAYTITKTVTTDSSGNATFAAGVEGGEDLNDFSLTVAGNPITLPDKEVEAGKIYNISRSAASVPEGAISGQFSVSSTKKVYFSKGNLQLSAANTWKFADNQWDYFGNSQYDNHRDLFGWGTGNNPNQTSENNDDYGSFTDWGTAAASSIGSGWRTLTGGDCGEWEYLFGTNHTNKRTTTSGILYAKATVNGVSGVILLPDDWSESYHSLTSYNTTSVAYDTNTISKSDWSSNFEAHGCVFLPAAGNREGTSVRFVGDYGGYWSSTAHIDDTDQAHDAYFDSGNVGPEYAYDRYRGFSVRLVRDVQ